MVTAAIALLLPREPQAETPAHCGGKVIRVATTYWPGTYWVDVADRKGWFKEAGLNVQVIDTQSDYIGSFKDLVDGKLDTADLTFFDFALYNAQNKNLVGVLVTDYSCGAEAIIAKPGIESIRDLAGKKLALAKGTYLDYMWTIAAQRERLQTDTVSVADYPAEEANSALANGYVDAIATWEPFATDAQHTVNGKKLFSTAEVIGMNGGIQCFRREFIKNRPNDVQAILKVWRRASVYIQQHRDEAYAIIAANYQKNEDEVRQFTDCDKVLDLRDNEIAFSFAAGFDSLHGTLRQMNDFMLTRGITQNRIDTASLLDSSFLRELQKQ